MTRVANNRIRVKTCPYKSHNIAFRSWQSVREEGGRLNSGVRHPRVGETDTGFQLGMVPGDNFFQLGGDGT